MFLVSENVFSISLHSEISRIPVSSLLANVSKSQICLYIFGNNKSPKWWLNLVVSCHGRIRKQITLNKHKKGVDGDTPVATLTTFRTSEFSGHPTIDKVELPLPVDGQRFFFAGETWEKVFFSSKTTQRITSPLLSSFHFGNFCWKSYPPWN